MTRSFWKNSLKKLTMSTLSSKISNTSRIPELIFLRSVETTARHERFFDDLMKKSLREAELEELL
jgi:hypothetical protein